MAGINNHIWLVETLRLAGDSGMTLSEIDSKWRRCSLSGGKSLARATFNRWRDKIFDTIGVIIECRKCADYRYYISNPEILEERGLSNWILDTYATFNALSQNIALKNRILVEDVPSSRNFLTEILQAMNDSRLVELTYKNFQRDSAYTFPVAPYCLKMFQKRWYLLALSVNDEKLRLYGMDRVENAVKTERKFKMPRDFDADEYFSTYFGVVHDESVPVEKIVIRAGKYHQHYLRTLPLHESQREIFTCDDYADFELRLRPTYDFVMELLKLGSLIEVLEPQSLRHDIHSWVRDLWEIYKND